MIFGDFKKILFEFVFFIYGIVWEYFLNYVKFIYLFVNRDNNNYYKNDVDWKDVLLGKSIIRVRVWVLIFNNCIRIRVILFFFILR